MKDAALPSPDNAALLYYQAFLLRPDPNMAMNLKISEVLRGAESDRQIRTYLGHCLPMIHLVEIASQMPQCTWGIKYGFGVGDLASEVRHLTFILAVDARTLAADGHYRAALERCLTMRRLSRQIGDDTVLQHLISRSPDAMALRTARHVLGVMPPDADILMWFRSQLAILPGAPLSFGKTLQADFESHLHAMRMNSPLLSKLRNELVETAKDGQAKEVARNLTDEQLLSRAREPYTRFLSSVFKVVDSDMSYGQKSTEMQRLTSKLREEYGSDPVAAHVIFWCATDRMIVEAYSFQVGHAAHINGIKAAVEVYLMAAKKGQLPEKLPDHLPKDPFTGRDFVYEITDEGFALRCQGEDFQGRGKQVLEFKVKSKD